MAWSLSSPAIVRCVNALFDELLDVHYGFFSLCSGVEPDPELEARVGQVNGLLGALVPGQLLLVTGLHTGQVPLRIEWSESTPALPGPEWEDVVEASWEVTEAEVELSSFEDFHDVTIPQGGWHRVRYSASAMQAGKDLDTPDEDENAPDRYLIQLWPAQSDPDAIIREGSEIAGYWHGVARGEA